jgi:hypothetical protein
MFFFNGLTGTTVSITGGAGAPLPNSSQTVINVYKSGNGNVETVYTVTAGKSFYLYGMQTYVAAGGTTITIFKPDGTTILFQGATDADASVNVQLQSAVPLWVYAAGEAVKVQVAAGQNYNLWGIEA